MKGHKSLALIVAFEILLFEAITCCETAWKCFFLADNFIEDENIVWEWKYDLSTTTTAKGLLSTHVSVRCNRQSFVVKDKNYFTST